MEMNPERPDSDRVQGSSQDLHGSSRGRAQRRFMDVVTEAMQIVNGWRGDTVGVWQTTGWSHT